MTDERIVSALERIAAALEARNPTVEFRDGHFVPVAAPTPEPAPVRAQAFVAQQPPAPVTGPEICPVHQVELRTTKSDGSPAKRAFCSKKNPDDTYCNVKGRWLG